MLKLSYKEEQTEEENKNIDWFIEEVKERLKSGRNIIIVIHGPTGSGKSYLGMKIATTLDKNFDINRILFEPMDFFKLVKTLPPDSFIMIDEAGAILDARRFMTAINVITSYVLETFRFKRINVIFTVPSLQMVDINVRRLMHVLVFQEDRGQARIYKVMMDYTGATYPKRIGSFVNVPKPPETLCEKYEEKKKEAFNRLLEKAMLSLGGITENELEINAQPKAREVENSESKFSIAPKEEEKLIDSLINAEPISRSTDNLERLTGQYGGGSN